MNGDHYDRSDHMGIEASRMEGNTRMLHPRPFVSIILTFRDEEGKQPQQDTKVMVGDKRVRKGLSWMHQRTVKAKQVTIRPIQEGGVIRAVSDGLGDGVTLEDALVGEVVLATGDMGTGCSSVWLDIADRADVNDDLETSAGPGVDLDWR